MRRRIRRHLAQMAILLLQVRYRAAACHPACSLPPGNHNPIGQRPSGSPVCALLPLAIILVQSPASSPLTGISASNPVCDPYDSPFSVMNQGRVSIFLRLPHRGLHLREMTVLDDRADLGSQGGASRLHRVNPDRRKHWQTLVRLRSFQPPLAWARAAIRRSRMSNLPARTCRPNCHEARPEMPAR